MMNSKWLRAILCAVAMAALSAPVAAQAQSKAKKSTPAAKVRKAKKTKKAKKVDKKKPARIKEYDFLGDELEGDIGQPDLDSLVGRIAATHGSLIKIRSDFVREIGKAAEDL